jgi:hypothetical protein
MLGISQRALAARANISQPAVAKACRSGHIDLHPDGSINPDGAATRAWLDRDRTSQCTRRPASGASLNPSGPSPQVDALLAKARWQEEWCERQEGSHYDRADLAIAWQAETCVILAEIPKIPDCYTAWLAETIDVPELTARQLLDRVVYQLLAEVENFPEQAAAAVMKLS